MENNKKVTDKINDFINTVSDKVTMVAQSAQDVFDEAFKEVKNTVEFQKELRRQTSEFSAEGTYTTFRAFDDDEHSRLLVLLSNQGITKTVKINSVLVSKNDNKKYQVVSIDLDHAINGTINVGETEVPISTFAVNIKPFGSEQSKKYNVSDNISVSVNKNDVNRKLVDFEKYLHSYKPSFFKKKTYKEAVSLYNDVKRSVLDGEKDSDVVNKFSGLLKKIDVQLIESFSGAIK